MPLEQFLALSPGPLPDGPLQLPIQLEEDRLYALQEGRGPLEVRDDFGQHRPEGLPIGGPLDAQGSHDDGQMALDVNSEQLDPHPITGAEGVHSSHRVQVVEILGFHLSEHNLGLVLEKHCDRLHHRPHYC